MSIEKVMEMAQSSQSVIARHATKSAMTPMIYLCIIVVVPALIAAFFFKDDPFAKYSLIGLAILTVVATISSYVYWAVSSPARLQSEDYQLRQEVLQMISKKGGKIVFDPVAIGPLAAPPVQLMKHENGPSA